LGLIAMVAYAWNHTDLYFVIAPYPPVPAYALNIKHLHSGSLGGYRIIQFETDRSAEEIQQFYRTELPEHGWQLLCSPTQLEQPGCPLGLSPSQELAEAYKRYNEPMQVREINIGIYKPGENLVNSQNRLVEVVEYRYSKTAP
jgi:hypothetical protein